MDLAGKGQFAFSEEGGKVKVRFTTPSGVTLEAWSMAEITQFMEKQEEAQREVDRALAEWAIHGARCHQVN